MNSHGYEEFVWRLPRTNRICQKCGVKIEQGDDVVQYDPNRKPTLETIQVYHKNCWYKK